MSWWVPYLNKGCRADFNSSLGGDFNSDPGNDSNIGCTLALQHLFESNLNNSPSPSHSNLVLDRVYICSGLLMVSCWLPYLPKGCRPDFNNSLGSDSNSGPRCLFEPDSNNGPSSDHSYLVSDEVYICSSLLFMISWWLQ